MARRLLGQMVMPCLISSVAELAARPLPLFPPQLSKDERELILRFAASFLWADLEIADEERRFFAELARELDVDGARADALLARPPFPEEIDPKAMRTATADLIRHVALHAIASDGQVREEEMLMFELLDDLLPRRPGEDAYDEEAALPGAHVSLGATPGSRPSSLNP